MKPTIKYLLNGEYHYATVKDIGDIDKLKTAVRSDLVGAINSLIDMSGAIPEDLLERLDQFESDIDGLISSGFNNTQLGQLQAEITAVQETIIAELEARVAEVEKKYNDKLDTVTEGYDAKVLEINADLANVKTNIETAEANLEETGKKLNAVELNVTEVTQSVDTINGKLESKIDSTEFDLLESTVKDNETSIEQNKKDIALKASQESLDLATGRITDAEAKIEVNAQGITSAVKRDELRKELDGINIYGANLLRNTRDWEGWKANVPARAYALTETYSHLHIQEQTGSGNYLEDDVLELEVGKTYTASVWAKSSSQLAKAILRVGSTQYEMQNRNGDIYLSPSWQRMSFSFVANSTQLKMAFTVSNVANSVVSQFAGGKLEVGVEHSGWQANEEDVYARVVSAESTVKQQADSITALVEKQTKIGDDVTSQRTEINQMAESIGLHATKLEEIDGEVSEQKASIELNAGNILSKVEQSDIDKSIEGISIDRRNLVLNSDFILDMQDWSNVNENFKIIESNGKKSLTISRSGLSSNMVANASSNLFEAKSGDKLSIGLDVTVADLAKFDVKTVAVLDLFDIRDTRVAFEEFTLAKLDGELSNGVTGRLTTRYVIDREDVAKARLRLTLYRNGNITFTNITIEKGDIKSIGWSPAPEDSQLVQANLKTMIDQNAEAITLKAESDTVDKLTGRLEANEAEFVVANDKITANINKLTNIDGTLEEHSAQITATAQELSSKMTSVQVDEMLADKKFATQSELKQTADGFTTTVGSITTQVEALDKEVKDTKYTWIMWADDAQGKGITANNTGKKYMGIAYNKPTINGSLTPSDYTWSKVVGDNGVSGISIISIVTEYRISGSNSTVSTTGWTTTVPARNSGQYLWVRERIVYSNGSEEIIGTRVVTGDKGDNGAGGVSITAVEAQFSVNSSKTTAPTSGWVETQPTRNKGQFLWRRDLIKYSNNSTSLTNAVVVTGDAGDDGRSAQLLFLSSDVEAMTFTSENVAEPSTQRANITAKIQNVDGNVAFTAKAYNGTTALTDTIALTGIGSSRVLNVSAFPSSSTHIEVTATLGSLTDTVSIFKLKHGAKGSGGSAGKDALVGFLTNESITLGANSSGVVASFATATGSFRVFEGLANVSSNATYSVASSTGVTVAINSSGVYTVTAMSTDNATAELKATYKGVEIIKTLTLAKSKAGATGAKGDTGESGGDAYTVVLSNESHAFAGDETKAIASSSVVNVIAYKGATKIASTIGTISGHVTGITTSISGNGTLNNTFTVNASTALVARNGVLTIPITVDGQTFTKTFSFTLALKGATGTKGDNAQLITLTSSGQIFTNPKTGSITPATITVTGTAQNTTIATWQYSVNGGSFTTTLPAGVTRSGNTVTLTGTSVTARTIAVKALNGSIEDVITIAKVEDGDKGDKGDKGEDGKDGVAGDSGLSIMLLNESQSISTSSSRTATPVQTINIPFTAYLGSSQIACTASVGALPTGVTVSSNTAGTASQDGLIVLNVASGANLGGTTTAFDTGKIDIDITANGKTVSKPFSYSKSVAGATARTFFVEPSVSVIVRNPDGSYTPSSIVFSSFYKDGTSSAKTAYARYWRVETTLNGEIWTELATQNTTSTTYTVSSLPKDITGIRATTYSNSALTTAHDTQSVMVVSNGIAVDSIDVQYYLSTSSTSLSGGSWSTTAPDWVNGRFMWSKTVTVLSDGGVSESKPVCITGQKGSTGSTGATGKGVSSITEEYAMNTSKTTVPTTWSTTVPTWSKGNYLWTRSKIVYTNPAGTDYTTPYVDTSWEAVNVLESSVNASIGNLNTSLTTLRDTTLPALEDGLLNKTEKEAVRQSLNVTKADKSGIDSQYTAVYGNSLLIGAPKTNLYNAKVAYNTAYGNLEVAINAVLNVSDGTRITTAQYDNVQTRFGNYQSTLATLRQRFEEAIDSISGKKVDDLEFGGRNLLVVKDITTGQYLNSTGGVVSSANWFYSDYINVSGMKNLNSHGYTNLGNAPSVCYYDANKTFIRGISNNGESRTRLMEVNNGEVFIRYSGEIKDLPTLKIEQGIKPTTYTKSPEDEEFDNDKKIYLPVRYIRDWTNGSSANSSNHWVQIEAYSKGTNVARGKTVTTSVTTTTNISRVTDGNTSSSTYFSGGSGLAHVQVDLGQIFYNIDIVKIWHYYTDSRTYRETKTEVSPDGVTWYTIFDSYNEGEYPETSEGRTSPNTYAKHESLTATASRIKQLAGEIDLSVKSGDVINSINVSKENISINANKINLNGAVTISSFNSGLKSDFDSKASKNEAQNYASSAEERAKLMGGAQVVAGLPPHDSGGGMHNNNHGLYLEVEEDILIEKVMINSDYSGELVVELRAGHSASSTVLQSRTFNIKKGVQWIHLNFLLKESERRTYTLLAPVRSGSLYRNTSYSNYPINAGTFKITGAVASGNYYYFYNIHVSGKGVIGEEYSNNQQIVIDERVSVATSKADGAQSTANTALNNAGTANSAIADIMSDLKITPVEKAELSRNWERIKAEYSQLNAQASSLGVSSTTRTNYTNAYNALNSTAPRIQTDILANMTTVYSLTTATRDTFKTQMNNYFTQAETISKAITDKIQDNAGNAQGTADTANSTANTVRGVVSTFDNSIINANPIFLDWTGTNPAGYSGATGTGMSKVTSGNGMGNAVRYVVGAGANHYLNPSSVTNIPYFEYITVEATFMLQSGTIDGSGVLLRYNATSNADHRIHFKDLVPSPVLNKWYTVTKVVKQASSPTGFTGYSVFPMGGWTSFGTVTAKTIQFDSVKARPSTEQEIISYEDRIVITDMATDGKITPIEKQQLKKEWATIFSEKTSLDGSADMFAITTEKTNLNTAYNTLNTVLNNASTGILANMTTTSTVVGNTFRAQFDDYYDKKAVLMKRINELAKSRADNAQTTANTAKSTADTALSNAGTANNAISDIMSDLKITPVEKAELSRLWERIKAEYSQLNSQASAVGVASGTRTSYTNAYNALNSTTPRIQTDILANMTTNYNLTTTTRDTFKNQINTYFTQSEAISKAITDKIQSNATDAQGRVGSVEGKINNAVTTIDGTGVTVKDGSFFLEDDNSSTKYSIVSRSNLLKDHSFELVKFVPDASTGYKMDTHGNLYVADPFHMWAWRPIGSPRVFATLGSSLFATTGMFGMNAVLVNSTNYVRQEVPMPPERSGNYTVSGYFTRSILSSGATPVISVRIQTESGKLSTEITKSFTRLTTLGAITRFSYTFDLNQMTGGLTDLEVGSMFLLVNIKTSNSEYIMADGIQLVKGSNPIHYAPEESLFDMMNGVTGSHARSIQTESLSVYGDTTTGANAMSVHGTTGLYGTTRVYGRANMHQLWSSDTNGHGYYSWFNSAGSRVAYVGFPSSNNNLFEIRNDNDGDIRFSAPNGALSFNGTGIVSSGSNSDGQWIRFYDGTQICTHYANAQYQSTSRMDYAWTFPQRFVDNVIRASTIRSAANITSAVNSCAPSITTSTTYDAVIRYWAQLDRPFSTTSVTSFAIHMIAIGKWK